MAKLLNITLLCVLASAFALTFGKDVTDQKAENVETGDLKQFLKTRKDASKFEPKRPKRELNKEDLHEECCATDCDFEERAEFSEDKGWEWVGNTLCELSIKESDRSCRCKANDKDYWFECGITNCDNPCSRGQFHCGTSQLDKTTCIAKSFLCDSDNDCGDWKDEPEGCKYSSSLPTALRDGGDYYGNVIIGGRPVCDRQWDSNDAKVVCGELGFNSAGVKAIPTTKSFFGSVTSNYRINEVECGGHESSLHSCHYRTRNDCAKDEDAGVLCVDNAALKLKGGSGADGDVYYGADPVCGVEWSQKDARAVCNTLFRDQFPERDGVVPAEAVVGSDFGRSEGFFPIDVDCVGEERELTECAMNPRKQCSTGKAAGVVCARCTIRDLQNILNLVKASPNGEDLRANAKTGSEGLKASCHRWDCSKEENAYEEYCKVVSFLQNAAANLDEGVVGDLKLNASALLAEIS